MERYKITKQLGDGTYGDVIKAQHKITGEVVAIKRMKRKYHQWDECTALKEVKVLRKTKHPNIVNLSEVIKENDILYMVFEFLDQNLYEVSKSRQKYFPEGEVRNYMFQVLQGLGFMHKRGYLHRDIKPENILVSGKIAKVADFGLAKEIRSRPPFTDYVSTRWYRAPEVLLRNPMYGAAVDVWAVGCMMAEMFTLRPLFPGSSEPDQLYKICGILGTPTQESWKEGIQQATKINYKFPRLPSTPFDRVLPGISESAIQMITHMLAWDPNRRPSCTCAVQFPFFQIGGTMPAPVLAEEAGEADNLTQDTQDVQTGSSSATGSRPVVNMPKPDLQRFQAPPPQAKENLSMQLLKSAKYKPGVDPERLTAKEDNGLMEGGNQTKATNPLGSMRSFGLEGGGQRGSLSTMGMVEGAKGMKGSDDSSPRRSSLNPGLPTMFGTQGSSTTQAPNVGRSNTKYDAFGRKRY